MRILFPIGCLIALVPGCMVGTSDGSGGSQIGVEECPINAIEVRLRDVAGERVEGILRFEVEGVSEMETMTCPGTCAILYAELGVYYLEAEVDGVVETQDLVFGLENLTGYSKHCGFWHEAIIVFEFGL